MRSEKAKGKSLLFNSLASGDELSDLIILLLIKIEKTMMRLWICVLVFVIVGCSSEAEIELPEEVAALENVAVFPADSEPAMELSLTRETSFGDTDELFLGGWLMAEVDNNGRVFLADMQETQLHMYNPDGSYNRQIGREGEGPGEYRQIGTMRIDEQYLHLMDRRLNRITRYDLETFEVAGETSLSIEQTEGENYRYPQDYYLTGRDEYLIIVGSAFSAGVTDDSGRSIGGIKLGWTGDSLSTESLFSFDASEALVHREGGSMMVMSVPYKRTSEISVTDDLLIHGWSEHFLFSVYDADGGYQRSIYYPYQNMPLERAEILDMYEDRDEQWFSMVRNDDMPDVWPSWKTFTMDDEGRIWVERFIDDSENTVMHVLANSGELLATVPWSTGKSIQDIKDGFLYSQEESDMGLREIIKYAIELD